MPLSLPPLPSLPLALPYPRLAVNTVDFYNAVSILYGTLEEFCTDKTCEVMSAGAKVCVCVGGGGTK